MLSSFLMKNKQTGNNRKYTYPKSQCEIDKLKLNSSSPERLKNLGLQKSYFGSE